MHNFCRVCDEMTEWAFVEDKIFRGIVCQQCHDTMKNILPLAKIASCCSYEGKLYDCLECGATRPEDKKYFRTNNEGITKIVCDKCMDSVKPKWSIGFLVALIIIALLGIYVGLFYN